MRLSIVIPTKDRPQLVMAAIRSALDGLPDGAEVLVVDDRSDPPLSHDLHDPRLRITVSESPPGASGARNWGVGQARGDRILFLDDDDLLRPGYADWVARQEADYGFSAISTFSGEQAPQLAPFTPGEVRWIDRMNRFRRQIAGLGCGFWIDRPAFLAVGGIAEDLRVNEDTEFSIRLLSAGLHGLRSAEPGVMVRQHGGVSGERAHLTHAIPASERAGIFGTILARHTDWLLRHPAARRHLLLRQVKLLARSKDRGSMQSAMAGVPGIAERNMLWAFFGLCRLGDRLRGR